MKDFLIKLSKTFNKEDLDRICTIYDNIVSKYATKGLYTEDFGITISI